MAQSVIGALRVNLGLDSAKFNKGLSDAQRSLNAARTQFLAVAGVATAAVGGLTALTVATSRTAAEIKQFSQVANAAPEELQRWSAGAKTVGIEQEKLADILKDVNDRVGDFITTGGGPMADFFENVAPKIGITADAFRDLSGPQAMQLYVSSLEKAGLSQQEMTFYLEAMASDATALIPLLQNGGAEMQRFGENARSLGGIMSAETVTSLNGLKLALADAGTAVQGVGYRISGELAPALTVLVTSFNDAMREGGALRTVIDGLIDNASTLAGSAAVLVGVMGTKYVAAFVAARGVTFSLVGALTALKGAIFATGFGALVIGAGYLVGKFSDLVVATGGWGKTLDLLGEVAAGVWEGIKISAQAIEPALAAVWEMVKASFLGMLSSMQETWSRFLGSLGADLADVPGLDKFADAILETSGKAAAAMSEFDAKSQSAENSAAALKAQASALASGGFERAREAASKLAKVTSETADEIDHSADSTENLNDALENVGGSGGSAGKAAKGLKDATKEAEALKEAMDRPLIAVIDGAANAFGDFVSRQIKSFEDLGKAILNSIQGAISQAVAFSIANPIKIGLGLSGAVGGVAQAGVASSSPLGSGGLFSGILGGVGKSISGFVGGIGSGLSAALGTGGFASAGIFNVTANAATAAATGVGSFAATLGAAVPVLGAIGLAVSFFKKSVKELDAGLRITVDGMDALVESFRKTETKRFWGLSKKVRTSYTELEEEAAAPIISTIEGLANSVIEMGDVFGFAASNIDRASVSLKISTKGLSDAEIEEAITEEMNRLADVFADSMVGSFSGMVTTFEEYQSPIMKLLNIPARIKESTGYVDQVNEEFEALKKAGEGSYETLERLVSRLTGVNASFDMLGFSLYDLSLAGAGAASSFVDLFGTLDDFNNITGSYYENFYSDAERIAKATQLVTDSLLDLGIDGLPATRRAFRELVEETEALGDDELLASLLKLSPAFAEITAATDALAASANALITEDAFATGFDYARSLAQAQNNIAYQPPAVSNAFGSVPRAQQDMTAELRGIRADLTLLQSTMQITAANTGRAADAADDTLAVTLENAL
ncbi:MAG: hypothetical protein ABJL49_05330 [Parasphingorhabdus sp.]|uniref:hypothetical protein n=1 Tax=Alphaproteobacteria TaxID=28211 RepID=UPI0032661B6A